MVSSTRLGATFVGAPGTVLGVDRVGLESLDEPAALVATTVTEYSVPFVRPVTVHVNKLVVHVLTVLPAVAVTRYSVISAPPSLAGAVQLTTKDWLATVTSGASGASGVVRGVAELELEATESPAAFVATTVTEYEVPLSRPTTSHVSGPEVQSHVVVFVPSSAVTV